MHILFIAGWYPNPDKSIHHGIFIKRHAEAIALKHQVTVLHIFSSDKDETKVSNSGNLNEVLVSYKKPDNSFPFFKFISSYKNLKNTFLSAYNLIEEQFGTPNIIHQNIVFPQGIFAAMLSKNHNIPVLISEQWSGYLPEDNSYNNFITKYFTQKTVRQASAITTVSKALMAAMKSKSLSGKYFVVPNIVDVTIFKPNPSKKLNSITKIIHVSSLNDKEKNISCLIKSFQIVKQHDFDFELHIVGDSDERIGFEKLTKQLNLKNEIIFHGSVHPLDLIKLYQQSDFFVLSSNYETFCVVLIEALACGLPIVATNVGAVSEIVNLQNGLLANSKNPENFAAQIMLMLETYHKYNASELRASVETRFSKETISRKFDEVYRKIS